MARAGGAAKRYAQAAFELAREQGALDLWNQSLQRLVQIMSEPLVEEFLTSPAIPEDAKQQAIEQLLPEPEQQQVRNLLLLLLERGRLHQLPAVAEVFQDLVLDERGIAIADVTTAVELTPEELHQISARLSGVIGKDVQIRPRIDPSIIGGIVVRVEDTLIDGSVRTQLRELRQQLVS